MLIRSPRTRLCWQPPTDCQRIFRALLVGLPFVLVALLWYILLVGVYRLLRRHKQERVELPLSANTERYIFVSERQSLSPVNLLLLTHDLRQGADGRACWSKESGLAVLILYLRPP